MKFKFIIFVSLALSLINCQSGVDFESMAVNPEHIIDYGLRAKEYKLSVGAKAYAALKTGSSSAGAYAFSGDLASIERSLRVIVNLPYDHVFGAAGNTAVNDFKTYLDALVVTIRSKAEDAATSQNGAIDLLNELGTKSLSPAFAANLAAKVQELARNVPQEAKALADANSKIIEDSVKRIYQQAAVLSQSLVQKEANTKVGVILKALDGLLVKTNNDPSLIGGSAARDLGILEVNKAINRFKSAQAEISKISTLTKVRPNLLAYSSGDLADLKRDYIDKAASAKDLYDEADKARRELDTLVGVWREDIKNGPHAGLENIVRSAFGKVSLLSEAVDIDDETDLMRLMRLLNNKSVVATSADDNFIDALGGAVAMNVAQELGLSVANVYALNPASLNDTKSTFGMDDEAFGLYVSSQADKIYQLTSKNGEDGNIFVLFIDRIASGLKSADVINKLKQGKSKVVLVTSNPSQYDEAASFAPQGLDLAAAYHVAKAVVSDADPSLNANYIAQVQAKIMYAFKKGPRYMNLNAVITAAKDSAARLRERLSPSEAEYNQSVKDALASLPNNSYDVSMVEQSKILSTDVSVVVANIRNSQDYYINEARGIGQAIADADARRLAENERLRREQSSKDLKFLSNKTKRTIRQLNEAVASIDSKAKLGDILTVFDENKLLIDRRLEVIGSLVKDDLCSEVAKKNNITAKHYNKNNVGKIKTAADLSAAVNLLALKELNTYLTKVTVHAGNLSAILTPAELPFVVASCLAVGNVKTKVEKYIFDLNKELLSNRAGLRQARNVAKSGDSIKSTNDALVHLDKFLSMEKDLKDKVADFSTFTEVSGNTWWDNIVNTLGGDASVAGAAGEPYRRLNRRMYALLFSGIVGRIYHPSVPFIGVPAVATELYQGFVDGDALVPKMMASINTADLSESLSRTLLIKEVAKLMEVYQLFIEKVYSLAPEDREAFEKNATPNDFLAFYNKLKTLIERADYLGDLKDLTKFQHELRTQIATHILPDEVMTMLNRYPATHPKIFYGASKAYFIAKWQSEAPVLPPPLAANLVSGVYAGALATFEAHSADIDTAIHGYQYQAMKKQAIAAGTVIGAANGAVAWSHVGGALPGGNHAHYNVIPPVTALKAIRFETGTPANYLNAQSAGVRKLEPIFADLVRIAGDIQASAKKIYFYLSLTKKN